MAAKFVKLRWPTSCSSCASTLAAGTEAKWDSVRKAATCSRCIEAGTASGPPANGTSTQPAIDSGIAGASARREHERRSERERRRKEKAVSDDAAWRKRVVREHPVIGRLATLTTAKPVVGDDSQATRAWDKGADGEEAVGALLEGVEGVITLHDRRVPASKANIDHIAVAASGIYVIDPKNYTGLVEVRNVGGWLRPDERLYVNNGDQTKLVKGALRQAHVVRKVIGDHPMPIFAVLCFVGPNWNRYFARPLVVGGVHVTWPTKAVELLQQDGPFSEEVLPVAAALAAGLRPA